MRIENPAYAIKEETKNGQPQFNLDEYHNNDACSIYKILVNKGEFCSENLGNRKLCSQCKQMNKTST